MNVNIIELIKEKGFKISRDNARELLLIFSSMGKLKKIDNIFYYNNEKCDLIFSDNKLVININISKKIIIYIDKSKIELIIQENNKAKNNKASITSIPNKYFRCAIERKVNGNILEHKGLEVKRDCEFGTKIEYFKQVGESYIKKTDSNQEDELPVSLVGISKVNEIDDKLLCNKKLVLFKD